MLSRTADHLFWMARYTERAEKPCAAGFQKIPQACATRSGFSALVKGDHMLSRTADHLFWMARYTEGQRTPPGCWTSATRARCCPSRRQVATLGWQGLLSISGCLPTYTAQHGEVTPAKVLDFMVRTRPTRRPSWPACRLRACAGGARGAQHRGPGNPNQTWLEVNRQLRAVRWSRTRRDSLNG